MLEPDFMFDRAYAATASFLNEQGIRAVMLDLDDTIVASKSDFIDDKYLAWIDALKIAEISLLLLSNGSPKRVAYWTKELDIEGFSLVGKPFSFAYMRGLRKLKSSKAETIMIGDQLFTDVLGANIAGIKSILVKPLSNNGLWHTRALRKFEKMVIKGEHNANFVYW